MKRQRIAKLRMRKGLVPLAAFVGACALVSAWAASRPAHPTAAGRRASAAAVRQELAPVGSSVILGRNRLLKATVTGWRYDSVVARNLFKPLRVNRPQSRSEGPLPTLPLLAPMPVGGGAYPAGSSAEAAQAQPSWVYAGYATIDGVPVAIVEHSESHRAEFLRVGQGLDGMTLREISRREIKLTRGGQVVSLPISQAFTATPLNEPPKAPSGAGLGNTRRRGSSGRDFLDRMLPGTGDDPRSAERARQFMENFGGPGGPPPGDSGPPGFPGFPPAPPPFAFPPEGGQP